MHFEVMRARVYQPVEARRALSHFQAGNAGVHS
jgi:hypothetical protein